MEQGPEQDQLAIVVR